MEGHISKLKEEWKEEKCVRCYTMGERYISLIKDVGNRESLNGRFFLIFEYEPVQRFADDYSLGYTTLQIIEHKGGVFSWRYEG